MTTASEMQAAVDKAVTNMERIDGFTNGGPDATVTLDGGVEVPSIQKVVQDIGWEAGAADAAVAAAGEATTQADRAEDAADDIRNIFIDALSPSAPLLSNFGVEYDDGKVTPILNSDDKMVVLRDDGATERVISPENRWGDPDWLSPGVFDGEVLIRALVDDSGAVREAYGHLGGHFVLANGQFVRANAVAGTSADAAISDTYTGKTFVLNANENYHYVTAMATSELAFIVVWLGQSLTDGENNDAADPLLATTALYPGKALMPQGGPRQRTATGVAVAVDLVETQAGGGSSIQKDTPCSGFANHFIRDINALFGFEPTVYSFTAAQGARPYLGLKRGQPAYTNLITGMQNAVTALRALGFKRFITVLCGTGGQTDTTNIPIMSPSRYAAQKLQAIRQMRGDIKRITGESEDPIYIAIQPNNIRTGYPVLDASFVREGTRLLHRRDNCLCVAAYDVPHTTDGIHPSNLGKSIIGQRAAQAALHELFAGSWHGPMPQMDHARAVYWTGDTTFVIRFDAQGSTGLSLANTNINSTGLSNNGFTFDDGSGSPPTITGTSVAVTNSDVLLTVTLSAKPTGPNPTVGYALQRTGSGGFATFDGKDYGARGTLRDTYGSVNLYDTQTYWPVCPAFILQLPPRV